MLTEREERRQAALEKQAMSPCRNGHEKRGFSPYEKGANWYLSHANGRESVRCRDCEREAKFRKRNREERERLERFMSPMAGLEA